MQIYDEKSANQAKLEERQYQQWEREIKNKILSMSNPERKREIWRTYFPVMTLDDSYLMGNIF
jgi:hypothetical protein